MDQRRQREGDSAAFASPSLAEPALVLVTLAATASLTRLFDTSAFLPRLLFVAVLAHGLAAVSRRLGWPAGVRLLLFAGGFGVMITAAYLPSTGIAGFIPTAGTWTTAHQLVQEGWAQFSSVKAPAPPLSGYLVVAATSTWVTAWMSDWIAFRAWAALEALMPSAATFVFAATLGTSSGRGTTAGAYAIAVLAFVALHRASRDGSTSAWIAERRAQGSRALVLACLPVVLLAGAIGAVAGPALPGAGEPALTGWRHLRDGEDDRSLASPLVDLRKRLINQSNEELFTVQADRPAYWRLMSLEEFDGREWKSSGSFGQASGDVPHDNRPGQRTRSLAQRFQIGATSAVWVPAAFEVTSVRSSSGELRWDAGAAALIAGKQRPTADGLAYSLVSEEPDPTAVQVARADGSVPSAVRDRYLGLPGSLDQRVGQLARKVTAGRATPLEKARALEGWFRGAGGFTYSLNPTSGQSSDALVEFLFESRQGYCQQFAAAFAAMARTLGIPSRVAVGYTWGEADSSGTFHVKGRNAHAWPELWLEGVGWLPFEPTPGRGLPNAAAWSTVPPNQDTGAPAPQSSNPAGPLGAGAGTTLPPAATPTTVPASGVRPADRTTTASATSASDQPLWRRLLPVTVLALLAMAVWCLAGAVLLSMRRRRRRAAAGDDAGARTRLAWLEATESTQTVGLAPLPSESHAEFATRTARAWPTTGERPSPVPALASLATVAADARWSRTTTPSATATAAEHWRDEVIAAVDQRLGRLGRGRSLLAWRQLGRPRRRRLRHETPDLNAAPPSGSAASPQA